MRTPGQWMPLEIVSGKLRQPLLHGRQGFTGDVIWNRLLYVSSASTGVVSAVCISLSWLALADSLRVSS